MVKWLLPLKQQQPILTTKTNNIFTIASTTTTIITQTLFFVSLIFVILPQHTVQTTIYSTPELNANNGHYYLFTSEDYIFTHAGAVNQSLYDGLTLAANPAYKAHLLTLDDEQEYQFILNLLGNKINYYTDFWVDAVPLDSNQNSWGWRKGTARQQPFYTTYPERCYRYCGDFAGNLNTSQPYLYASYSNRGFYGGGETDLKLVIFEYELPETALNLMYSDFPTQKLYMSGRQQAGINYFQVNGVDITSFNPFGSGDLEYVDLTGPASAYTDPFKVIGKADANGVAVVEDWFQFNSPWISGVRQLQSDGVFSMIGFSLTQLQSIDPGIFKIGTAASTSNNAIVISGGINGIQVNFPAGTSYPKYPISIVQASKYYIRSNRPAIFRETNHRFYSYFPTSVSYNLAKQIMVASNFLYDTPLMALEIDSELPAFFQSEFGLTQSSKYWTNVSISNGEVLWNGNFFSDTFSGDANGPFYYDRSQAKVVGDNNPQLAMPLILVYGYGQPTYSTPQPMTVSVSGSNNLFLDMETDFLRPLVSITYQSLNSTTMTGTATADYYTKFINFNIGPGTDQHLVKFTIKDQEDPLFERSFTYQINYAAPSINDISYAQNGVLTISGEQFQNPATIVGIKCDILSLNVYQIKCKVQDLPSREYNISVVVGSTPTNSILFDMSHVYTFIDNIYPPAASLEGSDITVSGVNFGTSPQFTFINTTSGDAAVVIGPTKINDNSYTFPFLSGSLEGQKFRIQISNTGFYVIQNSQMVSKEKFKLNSIQQDGYLNFTIAGTNFAPYFRTWSMNVNGQPFGGQTCNDTMCNIMFSSTNTNGMFTITSEPLQLSTANSASPFSPVIIPADYDPVDVTQNMVLGSMFTDGPTLYTVLISGYPITVVQSTAFTLQVGGFPKFVGSHIVKTKTVSNWYSKGVTLKYSKPKISNIVFSSQTNIMSISGSYLGFSDNGTYPLIAVSIPTVSGLSLQPTQPLLSNNLLFEGFSIDNLPNNARSGKVIVTVEGQASSPYSFYFSPEIYNAPVTIFGSNFGVFQPFSVTIGNKSCDNPLVEESTKIICDFASDVPSDDKTLMVNVTVAGISVLSQKFIYNPEPVKCLAECSVNGECINGYCKCKSGFTGITCSAQLQKKEDKIDLPEPKNDTVTITLGSAEKNVQFNISIVSITERDSSSNPVKSYQFSDIKWTMGSLNNSQVFTNSSIVFNYKGKRYLHSSKQPSMKYVITISNWTFADKLNTLELSFLSKADNSKSVCGDDVQAKVGGTSSNSLKSLRTMEIVQGDIILTAYFSDRMLVDGRIAYSKVSQPEADSSTTGSLFVTTTMTIQHFENQAVIDPNFGALLTLDDSSSSGGCSDNSNKWKLPVIIVGTTPELSGVTRDGDILSILGANLGTPSSITGIRCINPLPIHTTSIQCTIQSPPGTYSIQVTVDGVTSTPLRILLTGYAFLSGIPTLVSKESSVITLSGDNIDRTAVISANAVSLGALTPINSTAFSVTLPGTSASNQKIFYTITNNALPSIENTLDYSTYTDFQIRNFIQNGSSIVLYGSYFDLYSTISIKVGAASMVAQCNPTMCTIECEPNVSNGLFQIKSLPNGYSITVFPSTFWSPVIFNSTLPPIDINNPYPVGILFVEDLAFEVYINGYILTIPSRIGYTYYLANFPRWVGDFLLSIKVPSLNLESAPYTLSFKAPIITECYETNGTLVVKGSYLGQNNIAEYPSERVVIPYIYGLSTSALSPSNSGNKDIFSSFIVDLPLDSRTGVASISIEGKVTTLNTVYITPVVESITLPPVSGGNFTITGKYLNPISMSGDTVLIAYYGEKISPIALINNAYPYKLVVTVPSGSGSTKLTLDNGARNISFNVPYQNPIINTVSSTYYGTPSKVTIFGSSFGFYEPFAVSIGGAPCTNVEIDTIGTKIICNFASNVDSNGSSLAVNVTVYGISTVENKFIYNPNPTDCLGCVKQNGECLNGYCKCKDGFTGTNCSIKVNTGNQLTPVIDLPQPKSDTVTIVLGSVEKNIQFNISIDSITEKNQLGVTVKSYQFSDIKWTLESTNSNLTYNYRGKFDADTKLAIGVETTVFINQTEYNFEGDIFTVQNNSMKYVITVTNWSFADKLNNLELTFLSKADNSKSVCGDDVQARVGGTSSNSLKSLRTMEIVQGDIILNAFFSDRMLVDGRITYSKVSQPETDSSTTGSLFVRTTMSIPYFDRNAVLDPSFSALLVTDDTKCSTSDKENKWKLPVIVVCSVVGAALLIGCIVGLQKKLRYKIRIVGSKMKKINQ
ncbi:hypothetical protein PPL_08165 [Heterostelium album PN500]|uniref:EGF-like domain-containing protein n=1 Tax=Heterostelium pallidum (strain ATCC 26659 / Pp 5 / PN500) TaxID=670386 RepID=D3BIT0_HETP5|nr:hypothetical protein PPL_08165 [Heterostelium album PN500]EFA78704.1 hypothetical protein PPL_08165 [Heterostelium album PN500]|eukprot:XP_020430828.1 hypothetical protein PPL_08165 [Heterostelium album PN500]